MNLIASRALSSFCHISASTQKLVKRRKSIVVFSPHALILLALATETVKLRVQKHERTGEEGGEEPHGAFCFLSFD